MNTKAEKRVAIWVGDEAGRIDEDTLLDDLDRIYSPGPGEVATKEAMKRLAETMRTAMARGVHYDILENTPVGRVLVAQNEEGVVAVEIGMDEEEFVGRLSRDYDEAVSRSGEVLEPVLKQLREYFNGRRKVFELPLSLSHLTHFQRKVLEATMEVDCGSVTTYGEIAQRLGRSKAARAVGQALARNPIPILIPCHRVLGSDGGLHGYSGGKGIETKRYLLKLEGAF